MALAILPAAHVWEFKVQRKMADDRKDSGDWYAERLRDLESKPHSTEADVSDAIVRPVLERILGFGVREIDAQPHSATAEGRFRPDFICTIGRARVSTVIVEVKKLGTVLTKRTRSEKWRGSPLGQLQEYLKGHRQSADGTWGIVTNGTHWIVTRREGERARPFVLTPEIQARSLADIQKALADVAKESPRAVKPLLADTDADWLAAAAECSSPEDFVERVTEARLLGGVESAYEAAYGLVAEHPPGAELLPQPVYVTCLRLDFPDGMLSPLDISQEVPNLGPAVGGRIIGVAFTDGVGATPARLCRGFIYDGVHLYATALIDPYLPGSRAERQFAALSTRGADASPKAVIEALSSVPLHHRFHEEIGKWFIGTRHGANELRHLIRVMFAWLLQERGILPDNALWDQGRMPGKKFAVHRHVNWLFTEVLAGPKGSRDPGTDDWTSSLVDEAPFLNGSLFSKLSRADMPEALSNDAYIGRDGLLTILGRYDWTLHDRTGYASESALDPTMLGDMFEQLILKTEGPRLEGAGGNYVHRKMPGGTYYTPQDVADEMAADAIAGWLSPKLPGIEWACVRDLAHPSPATQEWAGWTTAKKGRASELLGQVTVLDPCCGSGVFTLAMLHGLWRAKRRLSPAQGGQPLLDDLEAIIERQLHAVDIHPMAVLITRLRLFIALIDARSRCVGEQGEEPKPLPNLETRCLAADTLSVDLLAQRGFGGGDWDAGVEVLRTARETWTSAHHPEAKEAALDAERDARRALKEVVADWSAGEDLSWLDVDFLSGTAPPARFDIRSLFPAPKGGWGIVIGNPPYQKPDESDKRRGKQLGYEGAAANLYLMFIEAAVNVVGNGGCVTLVVPHSLVFGRRPAFVKVRRMMEEEAERVDVRTYDNMPQPLFPKLPWLKEAKHGQQNRQRATIMSFRKRGASRRSATGGKEGVVASSGVIRLTASNRNAVLKDTGLGQIQPRWLKQWTQAPTEELAKLLRAMRRETGAPPRSASENTAFGDISLLLTHIAACRLLRKHGPGARSAKPDDASCFFRLTKDAVRPFRHVQSSRRPESTPAPPFVRTPGAPLPLSPHGPFS